MTKLEKLKEAYRAAWIVAHDADADAWDAADDAEAAADDAWDAADDAWDAADDAWGAYKAELEKQQTTPREPVEDEGNPLV